MNRLFFSSLLFLLTALNPVLLDAQINNALKTICDSIEVVKDNSDPNFSYLARSRSYDISIVDDTLIVKIFAVDSLLNSSDPRDSRPSLNVYFANINDIGEIKFVSEKHDSYGIEWIESYVEITALRHYPLIGRIYRNKRIAPTDAFTIRVINQNDTCHFRRLDSLLNDFISVSDNFIPPSCEAEEIGVDEKTRKKISAIAPEGLDKTVRLNDNEDISAELESVLIDYIKEQNIKKLYGYIVINQDSEFTYFDSWQNEMYNHLNTLDSIPAAYSVMRETGYFKITDKQKADVEKILKTLNWSAGECNDKRVTSFVHFHIDNPGFIESEK